MICLFTVKSKNDVVFRFWPIISEASDRQTKADELNIYYLMLMLHIRRYK